MEQQAFYIFCFVRTEERYVGKRGTKTVICALKGRAKELPSDYLQSSQDKSFFSCSRFFCFCFCCFILGVDKLCVGLFSPCTCVLVISSCSVLVFLYILFVPLMLFALFGFFLICLCQSMRRKFCFMLFRRLLNFLSMASEETKICCVF